MSYRLLHKKSSVIENGKPKLPKVDQLEHGELAINFGKGVETISIKNSDNEIISFNVTEEKFNTLEKQVDDNQKSYTTSFNKLNENLSAETEARENAINHLLTDVIGEIDGTVSDAISNAIQTAQSFNNKINEKSDGHVRISATSNSDGSLIYTITENDIASEDDLKKLTEEFEVISGRVTTFLDSESGLTETIDTLKEIQDYFAEHGTEVTNMMSAITENNESIDSLSSYTQSAINEINSAITTNVEALESLSSQTQSKFIEVESAITQNTESIEEVSSQLNINVGNIQLLSADVVTHSEKITTLESYVEELEKQVDEQEEVTTDALNFLNKRIDNNFILITYNELKSLKEEGKLNQGSLYRIIDYITITSQENTQSANHQFDIIVEALSKNVLSEDAKSIQHEGDDYFNNSDLNAWEIKYCIDNDTIRFAWVDTDNGKGVIYYMKDEFNNEAWYDFKNIQFFRSSQWFDENNEFAIMDSFDKTNGFYFYTFSRIVNDMIIDDSLVYNSNYYAYNNKLGRNSDRLTKISDTIFVNTNGQVHTNTIADGYKDNTIAGNFYQNQIDVRFRNNIIQGDFYYNTIATVFTDNQIYGSFFHNNTKSNTTNNIFKGIIKYNSFGGYFKENIFENECVCEGNVFSNFCTKNVVHKSFIYNNLGTKFYNNKIHNNFNFNKTGEDFYNNTFTHNIKYCIFGSYFNYNSFGIADTEKGDVEYCNFGSGNYSIENYPAMKNITISPNCFYKTDSTVYLQGLTFNDGTNIKEVLSNYNGEETLYVYKISGGEISETTVYGKHKFSDLKATENQLKQNITDVENKLLTPIYSNPQLDFESTSNNSNCYGYVGTLDNINVNGNLILIDSISVYVREGFVSPNLDVPVWCRLLKFVNNTWETVYQSIDSKSINGIAPETLFSFKMKAIDDTNKLIKSTDKIAIVYVSSENDPALSSVELGFKAIMNIGGGLSNPLANDSRGVDNWAPAFVIGYLSMADNLDNVVTTDEYQVINGLKRFDNGLSFIGKTLISSEIDPGELKVFPQGNNTNKGFIIRTNNRNDNIPTIELLATNTQTSYNYQFPKKTGTISLGVKINNNDYFTNINNGLIEINETFVTNNNFNTTIDTINNHILENEEIVAQTIEYLTEEIEKLKEIINKL